MTHYNPLTQVIAACFPRDEDERALWLRRVRHWATLGKVLPSAPGVANGEGRLRRYSDEAVPLIALLLQMANRHSADELDAISRLIEKNLVGRSPFVRHWRTALAADPDADPDIFLTVGYPGDSRSEFAVRCGPSPILTSDDTDAYVIRLTRFFGNLRDLREALP